MNSSKDFRKNSSNQSRNSIKENFELRNKVPEIPVTDYDDEEVDDNHSEPVYDVYEDFGQIEGLERIQDEEPDSRSVRNRLNQNVRKRNNLSENNKMTLTNARKIAKQMGVLREDSNNVNYGFEPEADYVEEPNGRVTYEIQINKQRDCWAKSCKNSKCKIHSFFEDVTDNDEPTVSYFSYKTKYQKINRSIDVLSELLSYILIWSRDLRKIEAFYGTGIVAYFYFLRWLLFINVLIGLSVILLIIIPQTSFKPFDDSNTTSIICTPTSAPNYTSFASESKTNIFLDLLQGTGVMNDTIFFVGHYQRKNFTLPYTNLKYDMSLAYLACTVFYFLFCFVLMLKYTTDGMRDTLLTSAEHHQPYSSIAFFGWEFSTQNEKRFKLKQSSLCMEIKNCQELDLRKDKASKRGSKERLKLYLIRFIIFMIVGAVLIGCLTAISIVAERATKYNTVSQNQFNSLSSIKILFEQYAPTLIIFGFYLVVPQVFVWLIKYEQYDSPDTDVKITLFRMVFLRLSSVIVLLFSLLTTLSNEKIESWETFIGQSFYKLMIGDFILETIVIIVFDSLRKLLVKKNLFIRKLIDYQRFDIPRSVLSLVYIQALCWLGTFYCPMLPIICIVRLFILFYSQKFTLLTNCEPPEQAYRASRTNIIFILILIISFFISAIPIAYSIGSSDTTNSNLSPSKNYTPFACYEYMWQPIEYLINGWHSSVVFIINIITSTASTLSVSFLLCLFTYYYYVRGMIHKKMIDAVHSELKIIGADRIYLIDEISLANINRDINQNSGATRF